MVWLHALTGWKPGYAQCSARITPESPFVRSGRLNTVTFVEHMAQAVAVCLGYGAMRNGEDIRVGMVVACRKLELARASVPVGAQLVVCAQCLREVDSVSNFACSVEYEGAQIASAHMTLYHASEPPESS